MNKTILFLTIGFCLVFLVFEGLGASKAGKKWFENLRQPKLSFPFWVWYIIGGLYYIICGIIAYRVFMKYRHSGFSLVLVLLIIMMFINGLTNFFLFKMRSLAAFYFSIYPFAIITLWLFICLLYFDRISAFVLLPYLLWLAYDVYYFHFMWKLNQKQ